MSATDPRANLKALARPFPSKYVHTKPGKGGGSYVENGTTIQRILHAVGPYDWHLVELIRGDHTYQPREGPEQTLRDAIVGAVWRLTVQVDGREVSVCGAGDVEHPEQKANDGARAKDAESDALKRAAKHLGVGLHLWTGDEFYLTLALEADDSNGQAPKQPGGDPAATDV